MVRRSPVVRLGSTHSTKRGARWPPKILKQEERGVHTRNHAQGRSPHTGRGGGANAAWERG
eukprot:scaffold80861_cov29-Tisochrysis_lutea.AAC.5